MGNSQPFTRKQVRQPVSGDLPPEYLYSSNLVNRFPGKIERFRIVDRADASELINL